LRSTKVNVQKRVILPTDARLKPASLSWQHIPEGSLLCNSAGHRGELLHGGCVLEGDPPPGPAAHQGALTWYGKKIRARRLLSRWYPGGMHNSTCLAHPHARFASSWAPLPLATLLKNQWLNHPLRCWCVHSRTQALINSHARHLWLARLLMSICGH